MSPYVRPFVHSLKMHLTAVHPLIQVVLGPRQVGKTHGVQQLLEGWTESKFHYVSADGDITKPSSWLLEQWLDAQSIDPSGILIVDEIQKVENWSETLKKLWDDQKTRNEQLRVVVLGSSSLEIQKGLSESLVGRFFLCEVPHWSYMESHDAFGLSLDDYLKYGGYPASYAYLKQPNDWLHYMRRSIVEPVLGKDILSIARVKSPALFKQCFDIACSYAAQEISYTKLLGQLQNQGNVELVKHYLELFDGAYLLKQLFKFSGKKVLSRSSSPKILPLCPALYSITLDADLDGAQRGRSFEVMIGSILARLPGELYYWRERHQEVDYVYRFRKKLWAIEIKTGSRKPTTSDGLEAFQKKFPNANLLLIHEDRWEKQIEAVLNFDS